MRIVSLSLALVLTAGVALALPAPFTTPRDTCLGVGYSCARCMRPCCCAGLVCDKSGPPKCEKPKPDDTAAAAEWRAVPGGLRVHRDCIVEVPDGTRFDPEESEVGGSNNRTGCRHGVVPVEAPLLQIYAADVHEHAPSKAFTSLTADFVVPPLPTKKQGQVVYFWPGFKSKQPEMGYPVIQPVLQYGEHGSAWQLQSWFVDARSIFYPVVTAPAITVEPGDALTTSMKLDGDTWTIAGTVKSGPRAGKHSTLTISKRRAGNCDYDYAMLVNENINVNSQCTRMPASSGVTFSNVTLDGSTPQWTTRANCAGRSDCDCGNSATVDPKSGDVTLAWNTGA